MTDARPQPAESKMGFAVASLFCGIVSTASAVAAWYVLYVWVIGLFAWVLLLVAIVVLFVAILALGMAALEGSKVARRIAFVAIALSVLGPVGGCAGGYALIKSEHGRSEVTPPP